MRFCRYLLKLYFSFKPFSWAERPYRALGLFAVTLYRIFMRSLLARECQFAMSCSEFTRQTLRSTVEFSEAADLCQKRYIECSAPLNWVGTAEETLYFAVNGREVPAVEVSKRIRDRREAAHSTRVRVPNRLPDAS